MMNILLTASMMLAMTTQGNSSTYSESHTRGIGKYPGAPSEYFAPTISWVGSQELTNVALHRVAYASSAIDYNHTAHLVTDGLSTKQGPATVKVTTHQGILPRREAEWAIDGGPYSKNILMGERVWIQYDWGYSLPRPVSSIRLEGRMAYREGAQGYAITCQVSDDGQQWQTIGEKQGDELPGKPLGYRIETDPNKQEDQEWLPAQVLDETIRFTKPVDVKHFRLRLDMDKAAHWDIHELHIMDATHDEMDVKPSTQFSNMWISNGGGEQWIYTDLGQSLPIEQVVLDWYQAPQKGAIEVSDDAKTWRKVAEIDRPLSSAVQGRYVRLLLQETGAAGYYALREMKVMSRQQKIYTPHAVAGWYHGRYELSGGNWKLQRSSEVRSAGEQISSAGYPCADWIPATVPGTVLASYMNIGAVPNPNYADDVDQISESFFRSNFWYRDEFEWDGLADGSQQWLNFDGINWKANVFLNGQKLGRIEGAFVRGKFNVTGLLCKGTNYLAVEILCNEHFAAIKEKDTQTTQFNGGLLGADNPTFHATVGWDWITTVRGREAGIWNEVYLTTTGSVTVSDPYVRTTLKEDGKLVEVTPSVFVRNNSNQSVKGMLRGFIGDVHFEKVVAIPALAEQEVTFCPKDYPQLSSRHFILWYPNGYGEPYLYDAGFTFGGDATLSYKAGLREMRYERLKDSLQIFVNGRRFIPKGGNWGFDEHNLLYRAREYDITVGYHRDMNFTMIRNWVGQVGDEAFYEACDRHGIMIWQDFWLANPADGPDPYDNVMFLNNAKDYTRRMRSHASIGLYCGRNEGFPPVGLDKKLRQYVHELAPGMEYISHSSSEGVSGGGPYRALSMEEYFSKQSGKIHSERGMPNVMNIENMRRTFSPEALWPQSLQWGQHDFTLRGAQRSATFNQMVEKGFGKPSSAEEFCRWAQLINYNGYRGMFEATSKSRAGLLLWMSHPCWPSMVWQTYDYYFEPTAAYFGCMKACEPLHIQYNALTDSIEIVNHSAGRQTDLTAVATVFNLQGKQVSQQKSRVNSAEDTTQSWLKRSDLIAKVTSDVYFLRLQLANKQGVVSENLYIVGREDGNYQALLTLPKPQIEQKVNSNGDCSLTVTLYNKGKAPAPFLRLNLKGVDGEQILPVLYSDNYITLMPGESKTIMISWRQEDARNQQPNVEVSGL